MKDNRKAATNDGDLHYFTGKPCINGHVAKRLTTNGSCLPCENERIKKARKLKIWMTRQKRSRGEARKSKDMFYFTGNLCKNGHINIRRTINGLCEECKEEKCRLRREKAKKKRLAGGIFPENKCILLFYAVKWVNREKRDVIKRWEEEKRVKSLTS